MNRPSPGKLANPLFRIYWIAVMAGILLMNVGVTAYGEEKASGIVKPIVTTLSPTSAGTSPDIIEYKLPKKYSLPYGIAVSQDNKIWFTEMANHSVSVLDPVTNQLKEYRIPSTEGLPDSDWKYDPKERDTPPDVTNVYSVGNPGALIIAKNGIVWCVNQLGNSIVRFNPVKEEFTEYMLPAEDSKPYDIAEDSTGKIWFVEMNTSKLGRLDFESKKIVEISLGQGSTPMGIAIDKDDNIWFGEVAGNSIGRYDPVKKSLRRFLINVPNAQPGFMTFAQDGTLWFAQMNSKQLGVFMPDPGIFSVVDIPGFNAVPHALIPLPENRVWMIDGMMNRIGYFDTVTLNWSIFPLPTPNASPMHMAIDGKGNIWFTQAGREANRIGVLVAATIPQTGVSGAIELEKAEAPHAENIQAPEKVDSGRYTTGIVVAVVLVLLTVIIFGRFGRKDGKS